MENDNKKQEQCTIQNVRCSTFTKEELKVIKVDILHIFDNVTLSYEETHKRNLILNKLKKELGDEYYT